MPARKTTTRRKATKTTARKPAKRTTAKRTTTRKVTKKVSTTAASAIKEPMNKTALVEHISGATELSKKEVKAVLEELTTVIERHLKKRGAGEFTLPGVAKFVVKRKPATKARKGINPFTGEETVFKAKPARNVVKIRPLKKTKDAAA